MIKWILIGVGVVAFIGVCFIGTNALMCEPPCI